MALEICVLHWQALDFSTRFESACSADSGCFNMQFKGTHRTLGPTNDWVSRDNASFPKLKKW
jgi:hypothetical protein